MSLNIKRVRGLTHPIYLIHVDLFEQTECADFHIVGTTKRIYHVIIRCSDKSISCTCIDYLRFKEPCKHVYFVTDKILSLDLNTLKEENLYDYDSLQDAIYARVTGSSNLASEEAITTYLEHIGIQDKLQTDIQDVQKPRNEECGVCFDTIIGDGIAVMICTVCINGIHEACWRHWSSVSNKNTCIYCKRPYKVSDAADARIEKDDLGYFVLRT